MFCTVKKTPSPQPPAFSLQPPASSHQRPAQIQNVVPIKKPAQNFRSKRFAQNLLAPKPLTISINPETLLETLNPETLNPETLNLEPGTPRSSHRESEKLKISSFSGGTSVLARRGFTGCLSEFRVEEGCLVAGVRALRFRISQILHIEPSILSRKTPKITPQTARSLQAANNSRSEETDTERFHRRNEIRPWHCWGRVEFRAAGVYSV